MAFGKLSFGVVLGILFFAGLVLAVPVGPDSANITSNSTWNSSGTPFMVNTSMGYISSLNITATSQNTRWKAFLGWIEGSFSLADATGNKIYDWSISTTGGEVYATRTSGSVSWYGLSCADATEVLAEDTALEHSGQDNISSTFSATNLGTYVVSNLTVGAGDCFAINTYVDNITQTDSFEEFILHDGTSIIFVTEVEDNIGGYDGNSYDFQMIVPENGNESFTSSTSYYLYTELN